MVTMLWSHFRSLLLWFTACLMCLSEGERESTWGAEGAEEKIEKNIQLHYPRPPSIKK